MKYMTFRSSCSYAGLANLLSFFGVDTEDRQIALEMKLPYMFDGEDGCYYAGPMLQGPKWYNIYLNPQGFTWKEQEVRRGEICTVLSHIGYAMFGIYLSEGNKHAVIYTGVKDGMLSVLNNKWEQSDEPGTLLLSADELLQRVDETVLVGYLVKTDREAVHIKERLEQSERVLWALGNEIQLFCTEEKSVAELRLSMNTLFRPLLLDGITMLDLLGEKNLSGKLKTVQGQFMKALRENKAVRLEQYLDLPMLRDTIDEYAALIREQIAEQG